MSCVETRSIPKRIIISGLAAIILAMTFAMTIMPGEAKAMTATEYWSKTNSFASGARASGYDCYAYASDFASTVYGLSGPRNGTYFEGAANIKTGDILFGTATNTDGSTTQHWVVVFERNGTKLWTGEGGYNGSTYLSETRYRVSGNGIADDWGRGYAFSYGYHFDTGGATTRIPIDTIEGGFDLCQAGNGTVRVGGWAKDTNYPNSAVEVNIYVGGSGADGEGHSFTANTYRNDVGNHAFDVTFNTKVRGQVTVYMWAHHADKVGNPLQIPPSTTCNPNINIAADTVAPTVSNQTVTKLSDTTYRVEFDVEDNLGQLAKIELPTWNEPLGGEKATWFDATSSLSGNHVSYVVDTTKLTYGGGQAARYLTDIYARDFDGNVKPVRLSCSMIPDSEAPVIQNFSIVSQTDSKVVYDLQATDNVGVSSYSFKVWTGADKDAENWLAVNPSTSYSMGDEPDWISVSTLGEGHWRYTIDLSAAAKAEYHLLGGRHGLEVGVFDEAGNSSYADKICFNFEASPHVTVNLGETVTFNQLSGVAIDNRDHWRLKSGRFNGILTDVSEESGGSDFTFKAESVGSCLVCIVARTNGITHAVYVDVVDPTSQNVPVSTITINPSSYTLNVGETRSPLTLIGPTNATDTSIVWSSSNSSVATVSNGTITAVAPGTATITATAHDGSGVSATCAITVKNPSGTDPQPDDPQPQEPTVIKATPQVTLAKTTFTYNGGLCRPKPTVKVDGKVLPASNYTYSFDQGCSTVGTYRVYVKLKDGYEGSGSATYKIVKAANPLSASGKTAKVKLSKLKKKAQTVKKAKAFSVSGAQGPVTFKKVKGNSKIAVSSAGKVTVKKGLKKGTYKVTVNVTAGGNRNYKPATKAVILKVKVASGA